MTEIVEVVNNSLNLAEKYLRNGKPGRSYAHLLTVLQVMPELKDELEELFITVLSSWEDHLLSQERYCDLFTCYEQALELYKHPVLYNNLGIHLYR